MKFQHKHIILKKEKKLFSMFTKKKAQARPVYVFLQEGYMIWEVKSLLQIVLLVYFTWQERLEPKQKKWTLINLHS